MERFEYVIFNLLVVIGPLSLSFDRRLRFVRQWPRALLSTLTAALPFITWDWLVTGRHWWFNPQYTAGTYIGPLPLGEWLFFLTVPFASLFVWEVLKSYFPDAGVRGRRIYLIAPVLLLLAVVAWLAGREYTGLALGALSLIISLDDFSGSRVLTRGNAVRYALIIGLLMMICNGYLTARPVVLYDPAYQLDLRLITIPVEDFFYGYGLVLLTTLVHERLSRHV